MMKYQPRTQTVAVTASLFNPTQIYRILINQNYRIIIKSQDETFQLHLTSLMSFVINGTSLFQWVKKKRFIPSFSHLQYFHFYGFREVDPRVQNKERIKKVVVNLYVLYLLSATDRHFCHQHKVIIKSISFKKLLDTSGVRCPQLAAPLA